MPPPKAISRELRSPPALAICRSSFSTDRSVLCRSPAGNNSTTGSTEKELRNRFDQCSQISGEVSTNTRLGSLPFFSPVTLEIARSIRGSSESSNPVPANTEYFAEGVSTRTICIPSIVSQGNHHNRGCPHL